MNKGEYSSALNTTLKEQIEIIQSKELDNDFNAAIETCLTNTMFMLAHLTDEVSSVSDELRALREEITNLKGRG